MKLVVIKNFKNPTLFKITMEGVIVNFRGGRRTRMTRPTHLIVTTKGVSTKKDAEKLVNKKVTWKSPADKAISGKVTSVHGNSGAVRVIFEKGMPGQAIGQKVEIA